jgi:hypothetical protein
MCPGSPRLQPLVAQELSLWFANISSSSKSDAIVILPERGFNERWNLVRDRGRWFKSTRPNHFPQPVQALTTPSWAAFCRFPGSLGSVGAKWLAHGTLRRTHCLRRKRVYMLRLVRDAVIPTKREKRSSKAVACPAVIAEFLEKLQLLICQTVGSVRLSGKQVRR